MFCGFPSCSNDVDTRDFTLTTTTRNSPFQITETSVNYNNFGEIYVYFNVTTQVFLNSVTIDNFINLIPICSRNYVPTLYSCNKTDTNSTYQVLNSTTLPATQKYLIIFSISQAPQKTINFTNGSSTLTYKTNLVFSYKTTSTSKLFITSSHSLEDDYFLNLNCSRNIDTTRNSDVVCFKTNVNRNLKDPKTKTTNNYILPFKFSSLTPTSIFTPLKL